MGGGGGGGVVEPNALLQVEALLQQAHTLGAHLLQLVLQPQVVLDGLLAVGVPQPLGVHQVLHMTHSTSENEQRERWKSKACAKVHDTVHELLCGFTKWSCCNMA